MKQCERCSGRGFDSRPVHHKHTRVTLGKPDSAENKSSEYAYDGPDLVSTWQAVAEWTAG